MRRVAMAFIGTGAVTAVLIAVKSQAPAVKEARPPRPAASHTPARAAVPAPDVNSDVKSGVNSDVGIVDLSRMMDGDHLGAVVANQFGPVQVRISVRDGRMVDVQAVKLPTAAARGIEIGMRAEPLLREQALERQSADLDTVSGATYTSDGYRRSLQSAIDAARAGRPAA
jgi:uncharacterized protein with FMN-binding domain